MTREHVFAHWLIRQVHGARLVPSRAASEAAAPPPRIARVTGLVCADCNHGWMSGLEVAFRRILFRRRPRSGEVPSADRVTISRWFTKTAVLLADAQASELIGADRRPSLVRGMPEGVEVFIARRRRPRQPVDFSVDRDLSVSPALSVAILVDDLIGRVATCDRLTSRQGTRLWPLRTHSLRWETLPVVS